jgi:alpha-L-arabinofuranosidase
VKVLFKSAARDDKSGDVILKVVNASFESLAAQIELKGAGALTGRGKAVVLTSGDPLDENTLEDPTKVSPKTEMVQFSGNLLTRSFPGNSLTVIRLTTSAGKK